MDFSFILDSSGSIGPGNWRKLLNFVKDIVDQMPVERGNVHVGVISFGNKADLHIDFNDRQDKSSLFSKIDVIPWKDQWTNTSGGILMARLYLYSPQHGNRYYVPDVSVIITDGRSNVADYLTIPEAKVAKQQGIELFVIGITPQVDLDEIKGIATPPADNHVFVTRTFDGLRNIKNVLLDRICVLTGKLCLFKLCLVFLMN